MAAVGFPSSASTSPPPPSRPSLQFPHIDTTQFPVFPRELLLDDAPAEAAPHSCKMRKGDGPESKRNNPDPFDGYLYQARSPAFARIVRLGLREISLVTLIQLSNAIERELSNRKWRFTPRSRVVKRRKPNAFHWLDENWPTVGLIFDSKLLEIVERRAPADGRPIKRL
jgi:hypothetical protein